MGKLKDRGGYDKVVKGRKTLFPTNNNKPLAVPKKLNEPKESIYSPKKSVQFNLNPMGPTVTKNSEKMTMDDDQAPAKKQKSSILNTVQFKHGKKDQNRSTFLKLKNAQSKYSDIKQTLLKQINTSELSANQSDNNNDAENKGGEFNFVTRPNQARLTNAILKKVLNQPTAGHSNKRPKPIMKSKTPQLTDFIGRKINKKAKDQIKKNLWKQKIDCIKSQLKENDAKVKREKSVITGDMKPMLDSLIETDEISAKQNPTESVDDGLAGLVTLLANKVNKIKKNPKEASVASAVKESVSNSSELDAQKMTKRERKEKNLENEQAKSIQKQTIRFKKSQDDISLFNQLLDFKEFTSNPLDTLKKHFNA